jgi:hypothetical protein
MMPIAEGFLMVLRHEAPVTRRAIERIPDAKLDYSPHPQSMPMGILIGHISQLAEWGRVIVTQDELDFDPDTFTPFRPATTAEAIQTFDKNMAALKEVLAGKNDAHLMAGWKLKVKGEVKMEQPRAGMLQAMVISHLIHHRG